MTDDIRNHDPRLTKIERAWLAVDAVEVVAKSLILAMIALAVGIGVSMAVTEEPPAPGMTASKH